MRSDIVRALARPHLVDVTTRGRRSGRPHRIEVTFFNFDGRIYISGLPGRRDWYANLLAEPSFSFHLKGNVRADLAAVARPVTEHDERRRVFERIARSWRRDLDDMILRSPLVEVTFLEERDAA